MFLFCYATKKPAIFFMISTAFVSLIGSLPFSWLTQYPLYDGAFKFFLPLISVFLLTVLHVSFCRDGIHIKYSTVNETAWEILASLLAITPIIAIFIGLFFTFQNHASKFLPDLSLYVFVSGLLTATVLYACIVFKKPIQYLKTFIFLTNKYVLPIMLILCIILVYQAINSNDLIQTIVFSALFSVLSIGYTNAVCDATLRGYPYPFYLLLLCRFFILIGITLWIYILLVDHPLASLSGGNEVTQFNVIAGLAAILLCTICYLPVAFLPVKFWLKVIEKINISLALFIILFTLLSTSPWINYQFQSKKTIDIQLAQLNTVNTNAPKQPPFNMFEPHDDDLGFMTRAMLSLYIEGAFEKTGFHWEKFNGSFPHQSIELGGIKSTHICLIQIQRVPYIGVVKNHTCQVVIKNKIVKKEKFSVLIGPKKQLFWQSSQLPSSSISHPIMLIDGDQVVRGICRKKIDNETYIGVYTSPVCNIIIGKKIIQHRSQLEYLFFTES